MKKAIGVLWGVGFSIALGIAASPTDAAACGFAVGTRVDPIASGVAKAEKAVDDEQYLAAAQGAVRAFPDLKSVEPSKSTAVSGRALRVLAMAAVRLDGALTVAGAMKGDTADERAQNLAWAVTTLRALNTKRQNDPGLQTDLGEALAKSSKTQTEAKKLLQELADKDLVASAHGYAALARLDAAAGDKAARDAAVKKCEGMTKTPGICKVPDAQKSA